MNKYTFITEYKGGITIAQFSAINIYEALFLWSENLDNKIFSNDKKNKIQNEVKQPELYPVSVESLENVWCASYLSGKYFLLLNIIKTAKE